MPVRTSGTRILLARHGEAQYESKQMVDAGGSLTPRGRQQARELGRRLRGEGVTAAWCSTKARAVQTAELAAGLLGVEVTVREDLRELGAPATGSVGPISSVRISRCSKPGSPATSSPARRADRAAVSWRSG